MEYEVLSDGEYIPAALHELLAILQLFQYFLRLVHDIKHIMKALVRSFLVLNNLPVEPVCVKGVERPNNEVVLVEGSWVPEASRRKDCVDSASCLGVNTL